MKPSNRFSLNKLDWIGFWNRTKQTLLPYVVASLVAAIPVIIKMIPMDWEYAFLTIWILQRIWDICRRFYVGKK